MRYLIPIFFVLFSSYSFSADYVWTINEQGVFKGASPRAACDSFMAFRDVYSPTYVHTVTNLARINITRFHCTYQAAQKGSSYVSTGNVVVINRSGDSCPVGSEYNSETGECTGPPPDPCKEKEGQVSSLSRAGMAPDDFLGVASSGMTFVKANNACVGGCIVEITDRRCKALVSGAYNCRLSAIYAGVSCPAENGGPELDNTQAAPLEPPQTITEEKPCNYTTDANGNQVCESSKTTEKEGQNCGQFNGEDVCPPSAPSKNGIDIRTEIKSEATPDGGSKTTKTDTATVTKCDGIGKCVTTTTTTKTTTTKDGTGKEVSTTTECEGPACKSGGGVKDGTGDGTGICANGDCSSEGFNGPGGEDGFDEVATYAESLTAFMGRVAASPLVSAVTGISVPGGGSCSMPSRQIPIIGTISGQSMCDLADVLDALYVVFLALFGFAAVRVVMSA